MEEVSKELNPEEQAQVNGGLSTVQQKRLDDYRRQLRDAEPGSEGAKIAAQRLAEYQRELRRSRR